jgi:hypothetical protein
MKRLFLMAGLCIVSSTLCCWGQDDALPQNNASATTPSSKPLPVTPDSQPGDIDLTPENPVPSNPLPQFPKLELNRCNRPRAVRFLPRESTSGNSNSLAIMFMTRTRWGICSRNIPAGK